MKIKYNNFTKFYLFILEKIFIYKLLLKISSKKEKNYK